jgi:hypothetical protein
MTKRNLRAVTATDIPEPRYTITEAAEKGTLRQQMVALRERIAVTVEDPDCPPRDLASLSRRLLEITKEIEAIDARSREDDDGEAAPDEQWHAV